MTTQEIESQLRAEFDQKLEQIKSEFEVTLPESVKQKFDEGLQALEQEVTAIQQALTAKLEELTAARTQPEPSVQG